MHCKQERDGFQDKFLGRKHAGALNGTKPAHFLVIMHILEEKKGSVWAYCRFQFRCASLPAVQWLAVFADLGAGVIPTRGRANS